jgi:hypothetical protein
MDLIAKTVVFVHLTQDSQQFADHHKLPTARVVPILSNPQQNQKEREESESDK